jgi:hypothetical protein
MEIVVIGGHGLIGSKSVAILRQGRRLPQKRYKQHHGRGGSNRPAGAEAILNPIHLRERYVD